jgi:hypothetical protein
MPERYFALDCNQTLEVKSSNQRQRYALDKTCTKVSPYTNASCTVPSLNRPLISHQQYSNALLCDVDARLLKALLE